MPRPEDGSYNLKQNVPSLPIVYGRVKKGGDYVFLEESGGYAYHVIVWCGRRIKGFVTHYLHDEVASFDEDGGIADQKGIEHACAIAPASRYRLHVR